MELTGSEILLECLKEQGVDTIFGYPGGAVLNIYDALYKYKNEINHIRTCHEQGAVHAADGYARVTGKVGVCLATSGPGATNLVTGIATAYMDSVPLVAITGNVALPLLGKDSFQEVDIAGITMPITKHSYIVKDVDELASTIRKAFLIAKSDRPGPVLIDIPKDITATKTEYTAKQAKLPAHKNFYYKASDVDEAVKLINNSKRPVIYAGGGIIISDASSELINFADKCDAPVCASLMGLGGYPGTGERFTGMVGMHGTKTSNLSIINSDLIIAIGARFSDRVVGNVKKFAANSRVLHIDIDPAEINKNVRAYHSIIGDVKDILKTLNSKINQNQNNEWMKQIAEWKNQHPLKYADTGAVRARHIIEKIQELTNGEAIISTEVGQNQIWAAQCYKFDKPRTFISSGGLGTMGYGLGASIGAQIALPHKKVFNIAGDGSFRMNLNELLTAKAYNLPIVVVVLNNRTLGMVRQWQTLFYGGRYSHTDIDTDINYDKLAEAFGISAYEINCEADIEPVLSSSITSNNPVIINCFINQDDKVFPMVPPGAGIDEFVMEDEF